MNSSSQRVGYGADNHIVDFILGITFEIWEQRGIEAIRSYYADDAPIYALSGVVHGADAVVAGTRSLLDAFPDRILVGDDVLWTGDRQKGFYTSHRILSGMTNTGASMYGPATGRHARVLTVADCEVRDGVIVREWLMRDQLSIIGQLNIDPVDAARTLKAARSVETLGWIDAECSRVRSAGVPRDSVPPDIETDATQFAGSALSALWVSGDSGVLQHCYAPYAAMHTSAISMLSGRSAIAGHYEALRSAFATDGLTVDHVMTSNAGDAITDVAVRWSATGRQRGVWLGVDSGGQRVLIAGATHWRLVGGKIACEWTVFDGLAVLAQLV